MALTPEQLAKREGKITAGFCPYLMKGDRARILSEWRRLVFDDWEQPAFDPWRSKYGHMVEALALDHHQEKTGNALICRGEVVTHPELPHVCATLDAYRVEDDCVVDAKAWSSWQKVDYICSFLAPQIIVQRACKSAACGSLLLVHGGAEPTEYPLSWESEYEDMVWERIAWFWRHVQELICPVDLEPAKPAIIVGNKEVDYTSSNYWAEQAALWLAHRASAKICGAAEKEIKQFMGDDVKRGFGHGVECTRDRAGRFAVRAL
jgi:hypothetical protein